MTYGPDERGVAWRSACCRVCGSAALWMSAAAPPRRPLCAEKREASPAGMHPQAGLLHPDELAGGERSGEVGVGCEGLPEPAAVIRQALDGDPTFGGVGGNGRGTRPLAVLGGGLCSPCRAIANCLYITDLRTFGDVRGNDRVLRPLAVLGSGLVKRVVTVVVARSVAERVVAPEHVMKVCTESTDAH